MKILYTNADQFLNNRDDLCLQIAGNEPDIICITEIISKAQTHPINPALLAIPHYNMHLNFDPAQPSLGTCGIRGVGIYTAVGLNVTEVYPSSSFLDHLWISLKLKGSDKLILGCSYRSPSSGQESVTQLCKLLRTISDTHPSHLVVVGDFNFPEIDWKHEMSVAPPLHIAHTFLEATRDCFLFQHVKHPTRFRHGTTPSIIDLILTNEEAMVKELRLSAGLGSSDHLVLESQLECYSRKTANDVPKLALNKADVTKMLHMLRQIHWKEASSSDTITFHKQLSDHFNAIIEQCVPLRRDNNKKRNIYMTRQAMAQKKKKEAPWRSYVAQPDVFNHEKYVRARNYVRRLTRDLRKSFEKKLALHLKDNPKAFWQNTNSRRKTKTRVSSLRPGDETGPEAVADAEKVDVLNRFFASVFTVEDCSNIPAPASEWTGELLEDILVTKEQVEQKLMALRPASSPGPDGFHLKVLKDLSPVLSQPLATLFQKSLDESTVPHEWKVAEITPIFKKGSKHDPTNYRPVSLTSIISKLCESLVKDEIVEHLLATEQLHSAQHGFLPRRSCITKLLTCMEEWTRHIEDGDPVDVAYLDYKKAFDSVPHQRLLKKLHSLGIRGRVLGWIEQFLVGRQQRVKINGVKSNWCPVLSGIPQGTVLGPTLFLAFVNDLPSSIRSKTRMFADDTTVYTKSATEEDKATLQRDLITLGSWSETWLLPFNTQKCKSLHLGHGNSKHVYAIQGVHIKQVTEERDLGVVMDEGLKFRRQATEAVSKANRVLGTIWRSFANLDKTTLPILYKTLVRPLIRVR